MLSASESCGGTVKEVKEIRVRQKQSKIQVSVDIRQFTSGYPAVSVRQFIQIMRHLNLQLTDNLIFRHWNSSDHKCLMNYINSAHRTDTKKHKYTHTHTAAWRNEQYSHSPL